MKYHVLCLIATTLPAFAAITIDGDFNDWSTISTLATDPVDAVANPETDFLTVKVASDATNLYLYYQTVAAFDLNANGWRYDVFIDTDQTPTTGFKLFSSSAGGFDFMFQGATIYDFAGTDNTNEWLWNWVAGVGFGNVGNEAEFAIPLASLGLGAGDSFDFIVFGDNASADLVPDAYGSSSLSYTIVPEPTTTMIGALGGLLLFRRRR